MYYVKIINVKDEEKEISLKKENAMEFADSLMKLGNTEYLDDVQTIKKFNKDSYNGEPVMLVNGGKILVKGFGKGTFVAPVIIFRGKVIEWKDIALHTYSYDEHNRKKRAIAEKHTFYLGAEHCPRYYGGYSAIGLVADLPTEEQIEEELRLRYKKYREAPSAPGIQRVNHNS